MLQYGRAATGIRAIAAMSSTPAVPQKHRSHGGENEASGGHLEGRSCGKHR